MDKAELLSTFTEKLEQYARFRNFIDKAQAQSDKFSAAVIKKVCEDNERKSLEVGDQIRPMVGEVEQAIADLGEQRGAIDATKANADIAMEELQLRNMIGELSDEEFQELSSSFQEELSSASDRLDGIEEELSAFQGLLDRWVELAVLAGHELGITEPEPEPEEALSGEPEPEEPLVFEPEEAPAFAGDGELDEADLFGDLDGEPEFASDGHSPGEHASQVGLVEDMSVVFGDDDEVPGAGDEALAIEVGELGDDEGSVDIDIGVDDPVGEDLDILSEVGAEEVEIDLLGGDEAEELAVDLDSGGDKGPRRALLLYQEGTPEEQIYPFTSDVITIGRGRENDIQIKNDSKVSRYHCKIFRRGDNFYIEDNKSSNGSLVNGELITERRLFGGEEIVIGETFFRFRIME